MGNLLCFCAERPAEFTSFAGKNLSQSEGVERDVPVALARNAPMDARRHFPLHLAPGDQTPARERFRAEASTRCPLTQRPSSEQRKSSTPLMSAFASRVSFADLIVTDAFRDRRASIKALIAAGQMTFRDRSTQVIRRKNRCARQARPGTRRNHLATPPSPASPATQVHAALPLQTDGEMGRISWPAFPAARALHFAPKNVVRLRRPTTLPPIACPAYCAERRCSARCSK